MFKNEYSTHLFITPSRASFMESYEFTLVMCLPDSVRQVKLIVSFFYSLSTLFPSFQQPPPYIRGKVAI